MSGVGGGRLKWRPGAAVTPALRSRIGALGVFAAAALAIFNPSLGLWWGLPLAATSAVALLWPYRGSFIALAAASLILSLTGLPAWGRQASSLSLALGAVGLVAGFLALSGRVGVASDPSAPALGPALLTLSFVTGLGGAITLAAVFAGWVMIVPWIETALALAQTGLAFAVGAALAGGGQRTPVRAGTILVAFVVSLAAFIPLVWMLFLAA